MLIYKDKQPCLVPPKGNSCYTAVFRINDPLKNDRFSIFNSDSVPVYLRIKRAQAANADCSIFTIILMFENIHFIFVL